MARKSSNSCCAICEGSNLASICAPCVNYRLNEYSALMKSLNIVRQSYYSKLFDFLEKKRIADEQNNWISDQNEKLKKLELRLTYLKAKRVEDKAKVAEQSNDLKSKYESLELAFEIIKKKRTDVLDKFNTDLIYSQRSAYVAITSELFHRQSVIVKQICKIFPLRKASVPFPITYYNFNMSNVQMTDSVSFIDLQVSSDGKKDGSNSMCDQICNARLPRGLDPHSVPPEQLAASLGYMIQLLNLIVPILAAPVLHNSGFAGSCSRIWQRASYWDACPFSQSKEYPLFIPRQSFCTSGGENLWSDRSSSNFGVASVESESRPYLESSRSSSFNYSLASPHSVENHTDLQKGISLLKKSVAGITTYWYNILDLDMPSEASTFETFGKLLVLLSSSKELQLIRNSLKMACSRCEFNVLITMILWTIHVFGTHSAFSLLIFVVTIAKRMVASTNSLPISDYFAHCSEKQAQQLKSSMWNESSTVSPSSSVVEGEQSILSTVDDNDLSNSNSSFICTAEMIDYVKPKSLEEGWDIVEHPTFSPPLSETEDVEHWLRAMYIDVTKK
ncbi:hypothetical protein ZIOFF_064419 [Zingiber officinale]|uniref:Uncharacterized protein n=1 Tax=Zingiber officinale TaxID=94328 RepID=A0A8J5KA38_ZINOF|nr:hypothetical protein ZIOFF_064419 [Zingiber officinale]